VVGTLNSDGNGAWRAFLWQNGVTTNLGTLGGQYSSAYDVNLAGQVVGESEVASHDIHAFLWDNGTMTDLGTLGGRSSHAIGINDAGQIVGWSTNASGVNRAFLWANGAMMDIGTLGGNSSAARGINDAGQVVGASETSDSTHAFLWDRRTMTDLGTLGGRSSAAYGINDAGQVVGESKVSTGFNHAFLWPPPTTPFHNVGVVGDGGPLDVIIGTPVTIQVTAENKGNRIETFDVTTTVRTPFHSIVLETRTVTALPAFASESWSYTWDTTNVTPDVYPYALRFEASAVANETDLHDNTYWGPSVMVRYPAETSATPASTDVGLPISFTCAAPDLPPTDLTTYTWGFGDGVVRSGANVTHTYQASGTYTAGCLVTNRNGVTAAGYETVEINPSPSVVAAVDHSSAPVGTNLMFSATTTGGSGGFIFNWSFGDGSSAEGANVSHAYASPGDYTATIAVWDSAGSTAADSVTVSIVSGPAPLIAQASATPVATDVGLPIAFSCVAANGVPPYTFGWDFGDGDRASGDSATHAYAAPGTMTPTCSVTDGATGTASSSTVVTVYPAPSVTAAVDRVDSSPGTVLMFDATVIGGSREYTYTWDFGDLGSASGASVTHAYVAPGQYAASVLVRDTAGGVATDSVTVHVSNLALTLSASAISVTIDAAVSFQATADGGAGGPYTFAWDFGDQTTAMGEIVSHAYAEAGTKTASCTVTDASGATRTESMGVQVYSTPSVSAAVDHAAASPGSALAFSAAATGGSGDFAYTWDFGDNSGGSGAAVTHAYASADAYTATVTVQDSVGGSASSAVTVTVSNVAVTATANRATESPGKSITFSAAALGGSGGFAYHWVFGDDSTADGATVMHAFASAGLHTATVTATDSLGGSGSASVVVTVSSTSVIALSSATSASTGDTITFTASVSGGAGEPFTFAWDFGDGAKGTGATVTHEYGSAGSYTPKLTVTDASGSTAEKVLEPITVRSPTATATPAPTPSGSPDLSFFAIWGVVAFGVGAVLALYVLRRKPRAP
jgi:probable HAF family extracellular repeat protein